MGKRSLLPYLCVALAAVTAGCGSNSGTQGTTTAPSPTTTTTNVPVSPKETVLTVFRVTDGTLQAAVVHVPRTTAVASAALGALGLAAPVTISQGTATVRLDTASPEQTAEIVYTLTQFPAVQRVDVAGRSGLTRDDVAAFLPVIFVESPATGADVPSEITVSGSASVFEATLVVELVRNGTVLDKQTVTASEGAPARGTFETTLHAPAAGAATLRAYAPSAADGTPQHQVDVPLTVTP